MTEEEFNKVIEEAIEYSKETLINKSKEYSRNGDKLHNFTAASRMSGESREKCLWGMSLKQLVSVVDMINDMNNDRSYIPPRELVKEKLGDLRNYMFLLECSIEDKRNND